MYHNDVTWIIWCFVLPSVLLFFSALCCRIYEILEICIKPKQVIVYVDRETKNPPEPPPVYNPKKAEPEKVSYTDSTIVQEAIFALVNLGVKKSQARHIVNTLCHTKKYDSVDDLLPDCFSKI